MFRRLLLLSVLVVIMLGLVNSFDGRSSAAPAAVDRSDVPAGQSAGQISSTWFCAAATMPNTALKHDVLLLNPTDKAVTALVRGYVADAAATNTPPQAVSVPPKSPLILDTETTFGSAGASVAVESSSGELTVEHRLYTNTVYGDQTACSTASSGTWYFPALSTARTAFSRLTLFNPFPADASVDVQIAVDTGVRVPAALSGVVVPAGTAKVVELGPVVQRRDQFSATVKLKSGRAIAELTQVSTGEDGTVKGLAMQLGIPAARDRWSFAGGFVGTGTSEVLAVLNPTEDTAKVAVQVTPNGAGANVPEPIMLEVPSLRYALLDLSKESRIPPDGYHSITVESSTGTPVAVSRLLALSAAPTASTDPNVPTRPNLSSGLSIDGGSPVAGVHWVVPALPVGPSAPSVLFLHNPGPDDASVTATWLYGGTTNPVGGVDGTEIKAGDSLAVYGSSFGTAQGVLGIDVTATNPIVVERFVPFPSQGDFSIGLGIPIEGQRSQLVPVGTR